MENRRSFYLLPSPEQNDTFQKKLPVEIRQIQVSYVIDVFDIKFYFRQEIKFLIYSNSELKLLFQVFKYDV